MAITKGYALVTEGGAIKCGQAPAHKHADVLLKDVAEGHAKLDDIINHRLPLKRIEHALSGATNIIWRR